MTIAHAWGFACIDAADFLREGGLIWNRDALKAATRAGFDVDIRFCAAELFGDQRDEFGVGLAIYGRGFELRQPSAVLLQRERACAGVRLGFDKNDRHEHRIACAPALEKQTPGWAGRL